jgi:5-hydroxyisourate hydrolase-like protein (transthyretin family)
MKTKTILTLSVGFLLAFVCGNLSAQNTSTAGKTNLTAGPQAVCNHAVTNPDILVITGKIIDAVTGKPIANAKINFDKFGEELLQASVDDNGNYALALNKKELGEPIRVVFKVGGYKRYAIKNIDKAKTFIDADIFLQPTESDEKSKADVKYIMRDDPFNTMVIKMQ